MQSARVSVPTMKTLDVSMHQEKHLIPIPTYSCSGGRWSFVSGMSGYKTREEAERGFDLWLHAIVLWHRTHDEDTVRAYVEEGNRYADQILTRRIEACIKEAARSDSQDEKS